MLKICTKNSSTRQICRDGSHVAPWYRAISQSVPDLPVCCECCECVPSVDCIRSTVEIFEAVPMPTAKVCFSLVLCARGNEFWGLWWDQVVSAACPTISSVSFFSERDLEGSIKALHISEYTLSWFAFHHASCPSMSSQKKNRECRLSLCIAAIAAIVDARPQIRWGF